MAKKKNEVIDDVEEVVEEEEVEVVVNEPKKGTPIKVYAYFVTKDIDGLKTKNEFNSEGKDVKEALANLDFPRGVNCLVNTVVEKGNNKIEKALAPHKARAIFEDKKVEVFEAVYRGL